jgi:hypothetical protein
MGPLVRWGLEVGTAYSAAEFSFCRPSCAFHHAVWCSNLNITCAWIQWSQTISLIQCVLADGRLWSLMHQMRRWTRRSQRIVSHDAVSAEGSSKPCRRARYKLDQRQRWCFVVNQCDQVLERRNCTLSHTEISNQLSVSSLHCWGSCTVQVWVITRATKFNLLQAEPAARPNHC